MITKRAPNRSAFKTKNQKSIFWQKLWQDQKQRRMMCTTFGLHKKSALLILALPTNSFSKVYSSMTCFDRIINLSIYYYHETLFCCLLIEKCRSNRMHFVIYLLFLNSYYFLGRLFDKVDERNNDSNDKND